VLIGTFGPLLPGSAGAGVDGPTRKPGSADERARDGENCPVCGGLAAVGWSGDASSIDDDNLPTPTAGSSSGGRFPHPSAALVAPQARVPGAVAAILVPFRTAIVAAVTKALSDVTTGG
jgi:hypothetical protein